MPAKRPAYSPAISLLVLAGLAMAAHAQTATSQSELQLGVEAYKQAHYDEAAKHFQKAVDLDAANVNAHLYLATTYVQGYIPGVDSPDNNAVAEKAIEQYQQVIASDAGRTQKINSSKGIAYIYLNMKKFDDAKKFYRQAANLDTQDPENYYSIGVIDWTACYRVRMEGRAQLGMRPEDHLDAANRDQKKLCDELKLQNAATITEGIESLHQAIELRPDYDDAMAYMNLMFREKADVECDDLPLQAQDLNTADEWVDKTLAVKKAKAQKAQKNNVPAPPPPPSNQQ
jgi:tetratricopeptide (TPR) repeat protein